MIAVVVLTGIAFLFGMVLVFLDAYLKKEDPKVAEIKNHLPGYNCGSCGYGSCEGMAKAILENAYSFQKCKPMKEEAKIEMEQFLKEKEIIKKTNH